jgi:hypothetical protein
MAYSLHRDECTPAYRYFDDKRYKFVAYATTERCTTRVRDWLKWEKGYTHTRVVRNVGINLIYARR